MGPRKSGCWPAFELTRNVSPLDCHLLIFLLGVKGWMHSTNQLSMHVWMTSFLDVVEQSSAAFSNDYFGSLHLLTGSRTSFAYFVFFSIFLAGSAATYPFLFLSGVNVRSCESLGWGWGHSWSPNNGWRSSSKKMVIFMIHVNIWFILHRSAVSISKLVKKTWSWWTVEKCCIICSFYLPYYPLFVFFLLFFKI